MKIFLLVIYKWFSNYLPIFFILGAFAVLVYVRVSFDKEDRQLISVTQKVIKEN